VAATSIELHFADGEYLFALPLPQVLELQRVCGAGIFVIYGRVLKGRYMLEGLEFGAPQECEAFILDVYETIRQGLIGGGKGLVNGIEVEVSPLRARQLIEAYVHPQPLKDAWAIAASILSAKIEGYTPKKKAEVMEKPAKPRKASTTPK
jgi:hypothetical protein